MSIVFTFFRVPKGERMRKTKISKELGSICKKIFDHSGEEGLKKFLQSAGKDLPPVKLTKKEMQYLKGGNDIVSDSEAVLGGISFDVDAAVIKSLRIGRKLSL